MVRLCNYAFLIVNARICNTLAAREPEAGQTAIRPLVRVVGVDLAAEPVRTAVAVLAWDDGKAVVEDLRIGADDEAVLAALAAADKAGLDAPFGWPDAFAAFLAVHQTGDVPVPGALTGQQWRRQLAWRHTEETVRAATGLIPLSVAADRIGHAAMRCAGLLAKLGNAGRPVDRDGSGTVTEVYPAASLKQWGLPYRGYKQPRNLGALPELVTALQAAAPWLELGSSDRLGRTSHDALDAVIAGLTARAAALGLTLRPGPELQPQASREGRIALPTAPLTKLTYEATRQGLRHREAAPDRRIGALSADAFSVESPTPIIQLCGERAEPIRLRE